MSNYNRAFSLVEVLVASAILITIVVGVFGALKLYAQVSAQDAEKTQATLLAEEAGEAMQLMRDVSWSSQIAPLTLGTTYYLVWDDGSYVATTTRTVVDGRFVRTITLRSVTRNSSDQIAASGTSDEGTRLVQVAVLRAADSEQLVDSEFLVHNLYEE